MFDTLKNEVTKKPEQLAPEKLKQAQGLAGALTWIRKVVYFFFSLFTVMAAILYITPLIPEIVFWFLIVLFIIYGVFKIRDFVRGTI